MEAGQTIAGKYRLNRPLGAGGMASVWSATNVYTDRQFAIKFMLPQVAGTPEAARRFLREAKVSGRINHPNIIEVIDVGQAQDGALFLVMELLSGLSLDAAVRRRNPPMTVRDFLAIMRDVASALGAAHAAGVIHRDLKPTNIFLHTDRNGKVVPKLLDFGVSKVLEEGREGLTAVGTVLGSPLYMSPEQAMGADGIDGRTDVFAFGAILFEALCGRRAYSGANLHALIVAIATTAPRNIDDLAPELPPTLRALIRECMARDKAQRLASFQVVAERLTAVIDHLEAPDRRLPDASQGSLPEEGKTPRPNEPNHNRTGERAAPPAAGDSGGTSPPISIPMSAPVLAPPGLARPRGRFVSRALGYARVGLPSATGVLAFLALVVAVAGLVRRGGSPHAETAGLRPATAAPTVPLAEGLSPLAGSEPSRNVPTVSVDALPVAAHAIASRARNGGRLSIAATPGSCSVSIDGIPHGVTPTRGLEVSAGTHHVECVTPSGQPKTATVTVSEGSESRYRFTLPDEP
jgi:eukaryotic-like serine/threonine-protein kinase